MARLRRQFSSVVTALDTQRDYSSQVSTKGVFSIRRISIRRIPIIGLGLGLGIELGLGLGLGIGLGIGLGLWLGLGLGIAFGNLKFGELKRNRLDDYLLTARNTDKLQDVSGRMSRSKVCN